jgi:protein KRI1
MPRKKSAAKKAREQEAALAKTQPTVQAEKILTDDIEVIKKELREEELNESEESDDEEEDDYGALLTEDVENGLNEVLKAIKTGDQRLFDSNVKFFDSKNSDEEDNGKADENREKSKPLYLKEYHRKALLSGQDDEELMSSVDGEKPYVLQQREDKENLIKEIHNALGDEDEDNSDDDDFLIKKTKPTDVGSTAPKPVTLPDPEKEGGEKFLEAFMENHAWLPTKGKEVTMEHEDDAEFEDAAEKFENAYNFRYEDEKAAEIISYARSQATMRREKTNSRKRERLRKQEDAAKEKEEINDELKKKKQKKVNLVMDRIKEIKEAVGEGISEEKIIKVFGDSLMNEDFDDQEWDKKMNEIFNDEYYGGEDQAFAKPEWDDDIMDEEEKIDDEEVEDAGDAENVEEAATEAKGEESAEEVDDKSKKSKKKEQKFTQKQEKNKLKETAEHLIEAKTLDLLDEVEEERGRGKKSKHTFKYREVSPESFGLTYNELFKADDKDLNEFIGLKKLAPFRPKEKFAKDKRKVTKSKHLREWRKKTFGSEQGILETEDLQIQIPSIVFDKRSDNHDAGPKRKKRKGKSKKN